MAHAVRVRAREVLVRERFEVRRGDQHAHADEVVVQEVVQRREAFVAGLERGGGFERGVGRRRGQGDVVGRCELEEERGREGAFDVQVVFAFGKVGQELVQVGVAHCGEMRLGLEVWVVIGRIIEIDRKQ